MNQQRLEQHRVEIDGQDVGISISQFLKHFKYMTGSVTRDRRCITGASLMRSIRKHFSSWPRTSHLYTGRIIADDGFEKMFLARVFIVQKPATLNENLRFNCITVTRPNAAVWRWQVHIFNRVDTAKNH